MEEEQQQQQQQPQPPTATKTALGRRMLGYESLLSPAAHSNTPVIISLRLWKAPNNIKRESAVGPVAFELDEQFGQYMCKTASQLMDRLRYARSAYVHHDEINLVLPKQPERTTSTALATHVSSVASVMLRQMVLGDTAVVVPHLSDAHFTFEAVVAKLDDQAEAVNYLVWRRTDFCLPRSKIAWCSGKIGAEMVKGLSVRMAVGMTEASTGAKWEEQSSHRRFGTLLVRRDVFVPHLGAWRPCVVADVPEHLERADDATIALVFAVEIQ
ncbi:putative tRNA-His guanylyltransferase [Acanthamoeba castellanii medusavirus]|uniref:tRNA-His guanylyltransferase n=1 Tax=Acanthamoeba castellanii medusavirus J1 TaxID=3114988 RepID=A0A3T1CX36_9VIRU|nr:putative tRNA-His guanylyltransferase [Acanthamoeba castellanii medusavirus]BBI30384.1 putative tRNA-His guanylyltransferase [Acanthamoeba castellanii medusavirus J1]